jgi:hypothetical protein
VNFTIADFGQPQNLLMRIASVPARMFDHKDRLAHRLAPHLKGRIPQMMKDAGFNAAEQVDNMTTIFGSLRFYRGVK